MSQSIWHTAVIDALHRYSARHKSRLIRRSDLINEEINTIASQVGTSGITPAQTLSRVLQEFRKLGILNHVERGVDLLLDRPIIADEEDLPDAALDIAIQREELLLGEIPTGDQLILSRRRKGQSRLRFNVLKIYGTQCALCDVKQSELLIASHIVRWSDDARCRGRLSNVLCLCRMHDALFEYGYISFSDSLSILVKPDVKSEVIDYLQKTSADIRRPQSHAPDPVFLLAHRQRMGFV